MVEFKTTRLIYKARNNLVPGNMHKLFTDRGGYDYRGTLNMRQHFAKTNPKGMCISYCGVVLCNRIEENTKQSKKYPAI